MFENKVVWITGASSGIGEALAYQLSKEGARLILSSRNKKRLEEVRLNCNNPKRHIVIPLDLEDNESYQKEVSEVVEKLGTIDYLYNVGGVSQFASVMETKWEVERRLMEINFFGTVSLTKAVLPHMIKNKFGHIIVITSVMGKVGPPMRSAISAAKHSLHGYFDSLRAELWRDGINVTMICPGFVKTNLTYNYLDANGDKWGYMDADHENAMSPEKCARKIINAVRKNKFEIYVGGKETLAIYLKRFFPSLLIKKIGNYSFKRNGYENTK